MVLHEDFSGQEFLRRITAEPSAQQTMRGCTLVRRHQPLSRSPLDLSKRTLQGDRRLMLQHRLFVCLPTAVAEAAHALATNPPLDPKTMRRATRVLNNARSWWGRSNARYVNGVVAVLDSKRVRTYGLGAGGYPWTYPGAAAARVRKSMRVAFGEVGAAPISHDMHLFLEPAQKRSRRIGKLGNLIQTGNVFFPGPISPAARNRVLELEALHDEAARSVLCKAKQIGLANPGWCPGMRPAPDVVAEYRRKSLDGVMALGLPVIAPFAKGTHPGLTFKALCSIVQRKVNAHQFWTQGVLNGDTPQGFRDAWVAMFAHAIVHAEGMLGEVVPGSSKLKLPVRRIVNARVPGVRGGNCTFESIVP